MSRQAVDPRRATAERNHEAILDAVESLAARGTPLSMAGIAAEAGVSRPTLYAHYPRIADVAAGALDRAVAAALVAVEAAEPGRGPAGAALRRVLGASWEEIARHDALARATGEHLTPEVVAERHGPLMRHVHALVVRGQAEGDFRAARDPGWLVAAVFALTHTAADLARAGHLPRPVAREQLERSVDDLVLAG